MSSQNPFSPKGKSLAVVADSASPPTGVQVPGVGNEQNTQYRFFNSGTVSVAIGYGDTAALAATNSVLPTGTGQFAMVVAAGATEVFTLPPGIFISGRGTGASATFYVTPGDGQ